MNDEIIELDEANFRQEVLGAGNPVLVHFWAGWSGSCIAMVPILESVAIHGTIPVKVGSVNVERHEDLAAKYDVRTVPTLLIFDQGVMQGQIIGQVTEQEVREKLEQLK